MNDDNPLDNAANDNRLETTRRAVVVVPEEHQRVVTEGQLKWAQFHYKRRAQTVRQQVDKLWQTPATASEVDGAQSDDGNTTVASFSIADDGEGDEESKKMLRKMLEESRKNKPQISRGRRAMLRVSKRAFEQRREEIRQYGYRCSDDLESDVGGCNEGEDDALAAKFADEIAWKKARRNRRRSRRRKAKSTEERLRRFENAFRAMMMSLASLQPQHEDIATPSKIWTRPEDAPAFVSIDGRNYRDLKWGVSDSNQKLAQVLTTTDFAAMPVDPRASWLVHIPKLQDRPHAGPYLPTNASGEILVPENAHGAGEKPMPIPLGHDKFNEIVETLQQKAELSQEQMAAQLEMMKNKNNSFKWQINQLPRAKRQSEENDSDGESEEEDGDDEASEEEDEEEEHLDPEHLKTLAAEYLSEFVANADEEHLIATLGEQYRDEMETLVEAASDHGQGSTSASKDIVRKYMQGFKSVPNPDSVDNQNNTNGEVNDALRKSQMASFAGIAARYLAEVSRPRTIERTVNSCRQEQGQIVLELKAILDQLFTTGALPESTGGEIDQNRIEEIIAKYAVQSNPQSGCTEHDVVHELRQREGRQFLQMLGSYLAGVRHSVSKRSKSEAPEKKRSRGSVASRYTEALGKATTSTTEVVAETKDEVPPAMSEEQSSFEQISVEILMPSFESSVCSERDIVSVLRTENQRAIPSVVLRYLEALSASAAAAQVSEKHESKKEEKREVYFEQSRAVFAQLGEPTNEEQTKQRIFEAITSRYLANIAKSCGEDDVFSELSKPERQGFSRLLTKYLDEVTATAGKWHPPQKTSGPATAYLVSIAGKLSSTDNSLSKTNIRRIDVEAIVCDYLGKAMQGRCNEKLFADVRQQGEAVFSKLVAVYLGEVCNAMNKEERDLSSHHSKSVSAILDVSDESIGTEDNSSTPKVAIEKQRKTQVVGLPSNITPQLKSNSEVGRASFSGPKRASMNAGVASRYLSAVVDDCDDDDIFAELRQQESPNYMADAFSPAVTPVPHSPIKPNTETGHIQEIHQSDITDTFSPLTQSSGIPKVVTTAIPLDRNTAISFMSRLRSDCDERQIGAVIGNLENTDRDRAQFGRGVTRLIMGVTSDTLRATITKRSRASRHLAAMRGLPVDSNPEELDCFESAIVDEAAEILVECSGDGDPQHLAQALRKLGKEDAERFANFSFAYLTGAFGGEEDAFETSTDIPEMLENPRRDSVAESNFETESDFFAGMRQQSAAPALFPFKQYGRRFSHHGIEKKKVANEDALEPPNDGRPQSSPQDKTVLKSTFDSSSNRRDRFRCDIVEEKKTSQSSAGSSTRSLEHADQLSTGDAENIPFDAQITEPSQTESLSHHNEDKPVQSPNRSFGSPNRSHASHSEFSSDRLRDFHQSVMERSALIGDGEAEQTIIDTDGTTSEASDAMMSPQRVAGLMLSPTILTKRHRQAVKAIENKKWDQVQYLLSANPWLAEMPEISTNQYLLHKIAFYGAGDSQNPPAPEQLCTELIKLYHVAVQKFDSEGCLPLHKASEARNIRMIALLGDRFPSGASVRNEEGMLPIHASIASSTDREEYSSSVLEAVSTLLGFFPGALAVTDNTGNLPLHVAAKFLDGDEGIEVINFLLDEGDKQLKNPDGVRFRNKKVDPDEDSVAGTTTTAAKAEVESDFDYDDDLLPPTMVINDEGDIPLWIALKRSASARLIEALCLGPGGKPSISKQDTNGNNALHLILTIPGIQLPVLKSILKVSSDCAKACNANGMMPIEVACFNNASTDVILELLIADLPFLLSDRACMKPTGRGSSIWFLACECYDRYLHVLETLVSMCTYQQVYNLAFTTREGSRATLISCASPQCAEFLTVSLLFVGRFEFLTYTPAEVSGDVKVFEALDYGTADSPYDEGRRVTLRCFTSEELYRKEISSLRRLELDFDYVQQVSCFVVGEKDSYDSLGNQQFCIAVEQPSLTLDRVVAGMLKNDACRENSDLRRKYVVKIFSVLRSVATGLHRLHSFGVIHGNIVPEACGKMDEKWKLLGSLRFQKLGENFDPLVFGKSVPPEALEPQSSGVALGRLAAFRTNIASDPSMDVWGFGKLAFDVLVGEPLVEFDDAKELHQDRALLKILHWSTLDLVEVRRRLRQVGVPDQGVYMITKCLSPDPASRPSMKEILRTGPWEEAMHQPVVAPANLHEC